MRLVTVMRPAALLGAALLALPPPASAENLIRTRSLNPCTGSINEGFSATLFEVVFTPANLTVTYNINAMVDVKAKIIAEIDLIAYGLVLKNASFNPCDDATLSTLCPLQPGNLPIKANFKLSQSLVDIIPPITYSVPDLDGLVRVKIRDLSTGAPIACVEAQLSNGKTVDQDGVKWSTAIIAGLALVVSAVTSGLGHSNTAAHIAANALSLFGYFQSLAIVGMTSVSFPPIAQAWCQDFEWSMGIIELGFMQNVLTWYQRSTGGAPSIILTTLGTASVQVQKRSAQVMEPLIRTGAGLLKRDPSLAGPIVVKGITRVGFKAGIEPTNIFLTGLGIFVAFIVVVAICVSLFKGFCELAAKAELIKGDQFQEFRSGWKIILKGILFRIVLIGYAQMSILCLWELTVQDSAGEIVTAIFYFIAMTIALVWAGWKVIRLAQRSVHMHKNPAYILYSDPVALNKWGFLYVQFRATAYYFIFPQLAYILLRAFFVAFAQNNAHAQAIGILLIETSWLITVCVLRPWMDKRTNGLNISIAAVNFVNSICLIIFSDIFNQPEIVSGVLGVVFTFYNIAFGLILLIIVLVATGFAIFSKNPDTRYQPMRDDRGSFIKSQTNLNTELDALGATARGDMKIQRDLEGETSSFSDASLGRPQQSATHIPPSSFGASSVRNGETRPYNDSTTYVPATAPSRHATPTGYSNGGHSDGAYTPYTDRAGSTVSNTSYSRPQYSGNQQNSGGSQWQRGAGYDH